MPRLSDLPAEILQEIIKHVEYNIDLCALSHTNRLFYDLASEELDRNLRPVFEQSQIRYPESDSLHWAAEKGKLPCVRRLLRAGIPPAPPVVHDWHPIILAARKGHVDVVRAFLEHGVDPNPPVGFHRLFQFGNPLTTAIVYGHEAVVRLLIEHGVDLEFARQQEVEVRQPLSLATESGHIPLIKLLLEHGCNPLTPDYRPNGGYEGSAWKMSSRVSLEVLQIFLDAGVQPDFSDSGGRYHESLLCSLRKGDMPFLKFLFDQGAHFIMPKYFAYEDPFGHVDSGDVLYEVTHAAGKFPEHAAFLLGKIDFDKIIEEESLRAHVCLVRGAISGECEDLVRRLLAVPWVVQYFAVREDEWKAHLGSCLNIAIRKGNFGLVKLFLDRGADPCGTKLRLRGRGGIYPPIFTAAQREFPEIVELLLDRGADPFVKYFCTLFEKTVSVGPGSDACLSIVRILVERDVLAPKDEDNSDLIVKAVAGGVKVFQLVLQHMNVELQPGNRDHEEAFADAVEAGDTAIMEMFLKAGFDANARSDSRQDSFLVLAAKAGKAPEYNAPAMNLLLKYGADVEWRGGKDNLPLLLVLGIWDISSTPAQTLRILLRNGADPFGVCPCGRTLLEKAAADRGLSTVKVLLEHFDERNIPFSRVKTMVEGAARATRVKKIEECLWRWYWRRVYPSPGSDIQYAQP